MAQDDATWKAREFATLAGVSVRALHHYDRIGLLTPRRTAAGYRVYSLRDLERLEQIVVLKFIGVPLRHIAALSASGADRLLAALRAQRRTLERKRELMAQGIAAIEQLDTVLRAGGPPDPAVFRRIIEVIHMQNDPKAWSTEYEALLAAKTERLRSLTPAAAADLRAQWEALVTEIRDTLGDDPAGARAQRLGARWTGLLSELMGGPVSASRLGAHHQQQGWTEQMAAFVEQPVWEFMTKVLAASQG